MQPDEALDRLRALGFDEGDAGHPLVVAEPTAPAARAIVEIAERIAATRREQGVGIVKQLPVVA